MALLSECLEQAHLQIYQLALLKLWLSIMKLIMVVVAMAS